MPGLSCRYAGCVRRIAVGGALVCKSWGLQWWQQYGVNSAIIVVENCAGDVFSARNQIQGIQGWLVADVVVTSM